MARRRHGGTAVVVLLVMLLAGGTAYGVLRLRQESGTAPAGRADVAASPTPTAPTASPTGGGPAPADAPRVEEPPTIAPPPPVLAPGDRGVKVRALQARLTQLEWMVPPNTGRYDRTTTEAVRGFQRKRGFPATGVVDGRTWRRLLSMTVRPSRAELFDEPGPTLYGPGADGPEVREIQARLRQIAWFFGDVTDHYGDQTTEAVRGFQAKRRIPATGEVDQRTLGLLEGMTTEPTSDELANVAPDPADGAPLDPRCTTGRVLCIDKTSRSLRWVVDGDVRLTVDVRFGSEYTPTRDGLWTVYAKSRDHVSSLYDTAMPFAMFFSGGQAVHYSADFAARGYGGASHGCVNVRDYDAVAWLFDQVAIGDRVVVYWS